jgi:AcrR family transcriptional regulator
MEPSLPQEPPAGPRRKRRQPHQLPAGRHGLTRSYVLGNQRDRIVGSVIDEVSETGYAGLTVRGVVERAGVSRRTFYEHFSNKQDVFLAVYDVVVERLAGDVRLAFATGRTYPQQVAFGLETFLGRLAHHPALAHVCIVEVLAAGPDALVRRARALQTFCDLIRPSADGSRRVPPLAVEVAVGGIYEIVGAHVSRGDAHLLPSLCPELLEVMLIPFVGPRRAGSEAAKARERLLTPPPAPTLQ